jgi:hypothetical protein
VRWLGAGEPILWPFCLQATESVAKRVLFSCYAALAKVKNGDEKQNFKGDFFVVLQMFNQPFLRFTRGEKICR